MWLAEHWRTISLISMALATVLTTCNVWLWWNRNCRPFTANTPRLGKVKICRGCYRLMPEDRERLDQQVMDDIAKWEPHYENARQAVSEMPVSSLSAGPGGTGHTGGVAPGATDSPCLPVRVAPDRAVPWVGRFPWVGSAGAGGGGETVQGEGS